MRMRSGHRIDGKSGETEQSGHNQNHGDVAVAEAGGEDAAEDCSNRQPDQNPSPIIFICQPADWILRDCAPQNKRCQKIAKLRGG